jgi:hypothetical protein
MMRKSNTILDFFKRKNVQSSNAQNSNVNVGDTSLPTSDTLISKNSPKILRGVDINEFDINLLEFDPGLRHQIWEYDGPFRQLMKDYPKSGKTNHFRSFQPSWFNLFPL